MTDRIAAFLDRLAHLSVDDLGVIALPGPDPDQRATLLARADAAAAAAGRDDELREAIARTRAALVDAFSSRGLDPTWFGLNWGRSLGRAEDRARLLATAEDAAVAEVVADLLPAEDVEALREPFDLVASMAGTAPAVSPSVGRSAPRKAAVVAVWMAGLLSGATVAGAGAAAAIATLVRRRPRPPEGD
jgi:hypothetical protein